MQDLPQWLEATIEGLGFELVDVGRAQRGHIQLFIDKPEGVTIDDCAFVSNHLTRLFAVESFDYDRLEVSSPGLDRILSKPKDFIRFAERQAKLKLRQELPDWGKQKQFVVKLKGFENNAILAEVDGKPLQVELSGLEKARLVPEYK